MLIFRTLKHKITRLIMNYYKNSKKIKNKRNKEKREEKTDTAGEHNIEAFRAQKRTRTQREPPEEFRLYMEEMNDYYLQQQAYLQELNAQCYQQLFEMINQRRQMRNSSSILPGQCAMEYQPNGSTFSPMSPPINSNLYNKNSRRTNNDSVPDFSSLHLRNFSHPAGNEGVLYDNVVNGNRITISRTPINGPYHTSRVETPQYNQNETEMVDVSREGEGEHPPSPTNLYIAVTPQPSETQPSQAQRSLSTVPNTTRAAQADNTNIAVTPQPSQTQPSKAQSSLSIVLNTTAAQADNFNIAVTPQSSQTQPPQAKPSLSAVVNTTRAAQADNLNIAVIPQPSQTQPSQAQPSLSTALNTTRAAQTDNLLNFAVTPQFSVAQLSFREWAAQMSDGNDIPESSVRRRTIRDALLEKMRKKRQLQSL